MQKVSLFIPCAVDALMGDVGADTVELLSSLGFDLIYHEEQTCCGQPAVSAGHLEAARDIARRFIEIFEDDEIIASPSGSRVYTAKTDYPRLLAGEGDWQWRAEALGESVWELSQFLVDGSGSEDVNAAVAGKIAYHKSCHILSALGID